MKTRVSLKYFVSGCRSNIKEYFLEAKSSWTCFSRHFNIWCTKSCHRLFAKRTWYWQNRHCEWPCWKGTKTKFNRWHTKKARCFKKRLFFNNNKNNNNSNNNFSPPPSPPTFNNFIPPISPPPPPPPPAFNIFNLPQPPPPTFNNFNLNHLQRLIIFFRDHQQKVQHFKHNIH